MSPEELFLAHLGLIERLVEWYCRQYHFRREETEDFASVVKLKLIADDYRVFRQYQGRSKIETYLTVVVRRSLLDYLNHLWGKRRPSSAAERMGPLAMRLEELLGDGHSFDEACEILRTNFRVEASPAELVRIAARLRPHAPRRPEGDEQLATAQAPDGSPEQRIREQEREETRARALAALERALAQLSAEDQVIARLLFKLKIADIARFLGWEEKPLYRRVQKILKTLREAMEKDGVHRDDIRELLDED